VHVSPPISPRGPARGQGAASYRREPDRVVLDEEGGAARSVEGGRHSRARARRACCRCRLRGGACGGGPPPLRGSSSKLRNSSRQPAGPPRKPLLYWSASPFASAPEAHTERARPSPRNGRGGPRIPCNPPHTIRAASTSDPHSPVAGPCATPVNQLLAGPCANPTCIQGCARTPFSKDAHAGGQE
jgi:hypothetical protein